jgi:hypothetical protein
MWRSWSFRLRVSSVMTMHPAILEQCVERPNTDFAAKLQHDLLVSYLKLKRHDCTLEYGAY